MAERPIFVSSDNIRELVQEVFFELDWNPGFATIQKTKNIKALHEAAAKSGYRNLLEISTKSENKRGQHLSAFHLKVKNTEYGEIPLECAFQGSKKFEFGGPFTDLYRKDVWEVKRDSRLKSSGQLVAFEYEGVQWSLDPKTAFYDWLYVTFLKDWREWSAKLYDYGGFTDIEFNPHRSINCQARSCALFLTLMKRNLLDEATVSPAAFVSMLKNFDYRPQLHMHAQQQKTMFASLS